MRQEGLQPSITTGAGDDKRKENKKKTTQARICTGSASQVPCFLCMDWKRIPLQQNASQAVSSNRMCGRHCIACPVLHAQQPRAFLSDLGGRQRPHAGGDEQCFSRVSRLAYRPRLCQAGSGLVLADKQLAALNWGRGEVTWELESFMCSRIHKQHCIAGPVRPYVIWEAGSGLVLVDEQLAALNWGRAEVTWAVTSLSDRLAFHISTTLKAVRGDKVVVSKRGACWRDMGCSTP
eukprot:1158565-Pelagomonas_calceolata.AAC.1